MLFNLTETKPFLIYLTQTTKNHKSQQYDIIIHGHIWIALDISHFIHAANFSKVSQVRVIELCYQMIIKWTQNQIPHLPARMLTCDITKIILHDCFIC